MSTTATAAPAKKGTRKGVAKKKSRGPRGGVKHQPGRGHDRKSAAERKRRFAEKQRLQIRQVSANVQRKILPRAVRNRVIARRHSRQQTRT